jgi:hypothetical protein
MATKPEHEHGTPSNLPRGAWRTEVDLRVRELRSRLKAAEAGEGTEGVEHQNPGAPASGSDNTPAAAQHLQTSTRSALVTVDVHEVATEPPPPLPQKVHKARIAAVEEAIEHATEAIRDASITQRLAEWWTGSAITAGWESVHTAEAELVDVESEADVRASLPHLVAWLSQVMPTGEPRKRYEGELHSYVEASKPLDRTTVRLIYKDVVKANNESKANLRAFRNLLTVLTAVLALLLVVVAIWHAINPEFVSLCSTTGSGASSATTCVSGSSPRGQDVLAVELLGAIGGLLSLAVAFSGSTETPPSRYNVRPQQAALKVVAGAATGLIGVLIVQSGIIVSPATQTSSEALFLVYAAVFGFSQQLFTKFVDKRAESLLGESEEKKETKGSSGSSVAKA